MAGRSENCWRFMCRHRAGHHRSRRASFTGTATSDRALVLVTTVNCGATSRVRIFIEQAIGGMKRYNILVHTFRNRIENFEDDVIGVCAGLWNLVLSY